MRPINPHRAYLDHIERLQSRLNEDDALRLAVGGEFEAVGKLEYYLLRSLGLRDENFVVDVGCGSGRLACHLAPFPGLRYLGIDVVPDLLRYAEELTARPDWRFELVQKPLIPCPDGTADFVVFFSVFTHLSHEDTFRYLREAARCLKPSGKVVFSFLEFRIPCHWEIFAGSVENIGLQPLNQFIDRDAISAWASHNDLTVEQIWDGDRPHIPIPEEIVWENGLRMVDLGNLGQSVAVLHRAGSLPGSYLFEDPAV